MKKITLILVMFFAVVSFTMAQRTVTGNVSDGTEALIGASVLVKGTTNGTVTDYDGNYTLEVPAGTTTLVVSYTGYETQEIALGTSNRVDVTMSEGITLGDVVVTALGVSRDKKSLGYSTQEVSGDAIAKVQTDNFVNNLSGKVSGVKIRTNNNFGGSTDVVIRGNSSLTGNNQALFVVDGIPVDNTNRNFGSQSSARKGFDYGNGASDINPDDIASINVLKGAAATALYGSRAANGAVIITTKKGEKNKGLGVTVSSGVTFGKIDKTTFIEYQDEAGAGYGPYYNGSGNYDYRMLEIDVDGDGNVDPVVPTSEDASYGLAFDPTLNVYHYDAFVPESPNFGKATPWVAATSTPLDFFETAVSQRHSVAFSGGTESGAFRLGYTNFNTTGTLPNSELKKHVVNFSSSYDLSDAFTASFNGTYTRQNGQGRNSTGYSDNLMSQFRQWWEVNTDINQQRDLYELTKRNVTWNANDPANGDNTPIYWDNPYWTRYENYQSDQRDRFLGSAALNYEFNDWLSAMGRVSIDHFNELREERRAVGSVATEFGVPPDGLNRSDEGSGYQRYEIGFTETNVDFMLTADKNVSDDLNLKAIVGTNLRHSLDERKQESTSGGLIVPGLYSISNSVAATAKPFELYRPKSVYGYYGSVSLGYKNFLYVDVTDRYDISSTLPSDNRGYNYYSVSTGLVFSELMDMAALDFGKLRLSYAQVGNDATALRTNDTYVSNTNFGSTTLFSVNSRKNNAELKPESTASLEAGLELKFLQNRVGIDFAVYKTNTTDQIMPVSVSKATGYSTKVINAGEIENKGVELSINFVPVKTKNFEWSSTLNWTRNRNKVVSLADGVDNLQLNSYQGGISINATVGEPYGAIRGTGYKYHENGQKIVNSSGYYVAVADQVIGNANPDWLAGWSNTISYKDFSFGFLIDMQQGGDVFSLDLYYGGGTGLPNYTAGLNELGNPKRSPVSEGGGVLNEGVTEDGVANTVRTRANRYSGAYYWGNASVGPAEKNVYDASYVKLRELSLSYALPTSMFNNKIKGASVSIVANNVWIIHKNLPFADPESGLSSGNAQGYTSGAFPTTRTIGGTLKFDF